MMIGDLQFSYKVAEMKKSGFIAFIYLAIIICILSLQITGH